MKKEVLFKTMEEISDQDKLKECEWREKVFDLIRGLNYTTLFSIVLFLIGNYFDLKVLIYFSVALITIPVIYLYFKMNRKIKEDKKFIENMSLKDKLGENK